MDAYSSYGTYRNYHMRNKIFTKRSHRITPEEVLLKYMGYIQEQAYQIMYKIIDSEASGQISEIVSMVEDVKGSGGSGYVVQKDKEVLENWFNGKK